MKRTFLTLATMIVAATAQAGPYPSFSDPAHRVLPSQINAWATSVANYSPAPGVGAGFSNPNNTLGANNGSITSLGDLSSEQISQGVLPGSITVAFDQAIVDRSGADFAVFENASTFFTDPVVFAELAYVEVSSNGTDFVRFPSVSLNAEADLTTPFGRDFAGVDTTNIRNLAGVHPAGFGTPFDLAELADLPEVTSGLVDLASIGFVRLVDIPGNGAYTDSLGNPIFDTWLSTGSGGLDLDAVGAINIVPEPATIGLALLGMLAVGARRAFGKRA
ncbi:PEP-CTERM sorting domain-containing protein [Aeoliella sp. SH292]|uniref:PEP-CTERM sorting domain-containing protein n=1 Tax=Aeoliella sp. SH292 TaxID=3454464 RepID=UPI003F9815D0